MERRRHKDCGGTITIRHEQQKKLGMVEIVKCSACGCRVPEADIYIGEKPARRRANASERPSDQQFARITIRFARASRRR